MKYQYSFEKLDIWKLSIQLSVNVYNLTKTFPKEEMYGITSQLRRAANSIGANIAEGSGRKSKKDKARFMEIAFGSLLEVVHFLTISTKLGFISENKNNSIRGLIEELSNKINAFTRTLKM